MNKAYNRINDGKGWKNYPSDETPLNEQNLNKQDIALDEIDNRVITLDNTFQLTTSRRGRRDSFAMFFTLRSKPLGCSTRPSLVYSFSIPARLSGS